MISWDQNGDCWDGEIILNYILVPMCKNFSHKAVKLKDVVKTGKKTGMEH